MENNIKNPPMEDVDIKPRLSISHINRSTLREALPQIAAVCVKNVLLISWGLTLGFPTILIPNLSGDNPEEKIILKQEAISWIGSVNLIFVPLGCLISGSITQTVGRRRAMQLVNIPFTIAWLLLYFSNQGWQIFLALCLTGLSGGLLEAPVLTYVAEITQPHLRGILSSTSTVSVAIGNLIQFLLGSFLTWRVVALVNCCFPILAFILLYFVPETPIWLVTKNRLDEARKSIAWLRGWVKVEDVEDEFQELYKHIHSANNNDRQPSLMDKVKMFKEKSFLLPFFVVSLSFFFSHFNGGTPLGIYAVQIFSILKAPINKYYATVLMGCVQLVGCVMCMILINFLGKRLLNFISLLGTAACFTIVASYAYMNDIFYFVDPSHNVTLNSTSNYTANSTTGTVSAVTMESHQWIPLCFLILAAFMNFLGIRILPWILTGEVYPIQIRAPASGFSGGIGYIFNFIINKIFLSLVSFLSLPGVFWFFSVVGVVGTISIYFLLPETEGKSLFEITEHFAGKRRMSNNVRRRRTIDSGRLNMAFVCDEKNSSETKL